MPLSTALGKGAVWGESLSPAGNKHAGPSPRLPASSDPMVTTGAQETRFYIPGPSPGQVRAQGPCGEMSCKGGGHRAPAEWPWPGHPLPTRAPRKERGGTLCLLERHTQAPLSAELGQA